MKKLILITIVLTTIIGIIGIATGTFDLMCTILSAIAKFTVYPVGLTAMFLIDGGKDDTEIMKIGFKTIIAILIIICFAG